MDLLVQRAEFERRKVEFEKELRERTVRVGRRQLAAREWWAQGLSMKDVHTEGEGVLVKAGHSGTKHEFISMYLCLGHG